MELLKSIIVDFCLFGLFEGWICCLFFEKIGKTNKFKWYQILILSFINCIISKIFNPIIYQILMIIWTISFLTIYKKFKLFKNIKYGLFCVLYMLIIEMNYSILLEIFFNIDCFNLTILNKFIYMIPLRFMEILIIYYYEYYQKNKRGDIIEDVARRNS